MADELKPCPFCGGKATVKRGDFFDDYVFYAIECEACECVCPATEWFEAEENAVAAWNTRHERTCRNTAAMKDRAFTCSECWTYYSFNRKNSLSDVMFCPRCGARVKEG